MSSKSSTGGFRDAVVLCSTAFILGTLFTSSIADVPVLFQTPLTDTALVSAENYYLIWWQAPLAVKALLHSAMATLILGLSTKFATWTENAFWFDGGSLLLCIISISSYTAVTIPNIRLLSTNPDTLKSLAFPLRPPSTQDASQSRFSTSTPLGLLEYVYKTAIVFLPKSAQKAMEGSTLEGGELGSSSPNATEVPGPLTPAERRETVSVLCAGNVICLLMLLGVVILQVGEWYVEEYVVKPEIEAELREIERQRDEREKREREGPSVGGVASGGDQGKSEATATTTATATGTGTGETTTTGTSPTKIGKRKGKKKN